MSEIQFDVNVAIDVANDVLLVWWMEVYPFRVNQSDHCYMPKLYDLTIISQLQINVLMGLIESAEPAESYFLRYDVYDC